jgi:hypothetical protein
MGLMNQAAISVRNHCLSPAPVRVWRSMRRLAARAMLECFAICRRFGPMSSFCTRLVAQAESAIVWGHR